MVAHSVYRPTVHQSINRKQQTQQNANNSEFAVGKKVSYNPWSRRRSVRRYNEEEMRRVERKETESIGL